MDDRMPGTHPKSYSALRADLVSILRAKCPPWLRSSLDDLAQEAVLRVWEIQRRSEKEREFSSFYLRRVAYSVVVDEIRRRTRRKEDSLAQEGLARKAAAKSPGPEDRMISREMGQAIVECMERIHPDRRRALTLRRLGHGAEEVAGLLGWGLKEARNRIYRGLADLRLCLSKKGFWL